MTINKWLLDDLAGSSSSSSEGSESAGSSGDSSESVSSSADSFEITASSSDSSSESRRRRRGSAQSDLGVHTAELDPSDLRDIPLP